MEVILQELGLGTLIDRFSEERVDPDVLVSLNDNELVRLGVNTIGERVRLRELCRKKLADSQPGTQSRSSVLAQERSLLFAPSTSTSRRTTSTERKKKNTKKRPWTVQFMCLADRYSSKVPTSSQKQILYKAGLGIKKIKLDLDDVEQTVKDKITSDVEEDEVQTVVGFPQLRSCGGFEMMQCLPKCRDLSVINSSWSASALKSCIGGEQAKIYLRPIQKSLSTTPIDTNKNESSIKETCNICQQEFLVRELRSHVWVCTTRLITNDTSDESEGASTSGEPSVRNDSASATEGQSRRMQQSSLGENGLQSHSQREEIIIDDYEDNSVNTTESNQSIGGNGEHDDMVIGHQSVEDAVKTTITYYQQQEVTNPVEILRSLQTNMVYGRALDVQDPSTIETGETNFILVNREDLLDTAFDEINSLTDLRKTLEVQFYNEVLVIYVDYNNYMC